MEENNQEQDQDQEQEKQDQEEKGNIQKFLLPGLIILLVLFVGLFLLSYYTDTQKELAQSESQLENLRTQVEQLKGNEAEAETATDGEKEPEDKMVVVYSPEGLFTDDDKSELEQKLINPLEDYKRDIEKMNPLTMKIEKLNEGDYAYSVDVIFENSSYLGFLYGQEDPLEWWKPTCLDSCEFTEEYSNKYPEVVK